MSDVIIALAWVAGAAAWLGVVVVFMLRHEPSENRRSATISGKPAQAPLREKMFANASQWTNPAPTTGAIARDTLPDRQAVPTLQSRHVSAGLTKDDFEARLITAERAFARWAKVRDSAPPERLADDVEAPLRQALSVVASTSGNTCAEVLESTLSSPDTSIHRRQVAALSLLLRNEVHAIRLMDRCIGHRIGGERLARELSHALSLWRGRETEWRLREQARNAVTTRAFWLDRLEDRRIDPGSELLRELLAGDDPEWVVRGLGLAKYHDNPELRMHAAQRHLTDMRHPALRMAAVELAVFDRQPAAWMFCREMANSSEFPRATELVASFGTDRELQPILRRLGWAEGEDLWRLCRSGRKATGVLAARRLQDMRGDQFAAAGLRYVIGDPPGEDRDVEALLDRWVELAPKLAGNRRYLQGAIMGHAGSVRRCLTSRDARHHRAFGDELFFRSRGNIRWLGRGFAHDAIAATDALRAHTIDFEVSLGSGR